MIGLIVALAVLLGVGGTAVVADNAHPGDALFGVDQAVEQIQLNITKKENQDKLRLKFTEERIKELKDITSDDDADKTKDADIEDGDEEADGMPEAKKELTDDEKARISTGTAAALTLLTQLRESGTIDQVRLEALTAQLNSFLTGFTENAKIQINNERLKIKLEGEVEKEEGEKDNERKIKIEQETEEGRLRVEIKDGSIEIKAKLSNDNDSNEENADEGLDEIEAKIYSDKSIVKIEINDEETIFATNATTKEGIIAVILEKFPELDQASIEAIIEIETEDDEDKAEDDEDTDGEDEGENEDEDEEDDDNSGSGNSNDEDENEEDED